MKNAIKIAFAVAVATVGIAACTSTPEAKQSARPVIPEQLATPPSSTVVTETTTVTVTNPPALEAFVNTDSRLGYGALKLGMTPEEASAAGLESPDWGPAGDAGCTGAGNVAISKKYGIERITLPAEAKTSRGIGVGSTVADVKKAYPNAKAYRMGFSASLNDTGGYSFTTYGYGDTDKIVEIKLMARQIDCAFAML